MADGATLSAYKGQDFFVPAAKIVISGKELKPTEMNDLMSLTYTDSLTAIDSFSAVFGNWDAKTLKFKYNDASTFNPGKSVQVSMGYFCDGKDDRRPMLTGELTTLSPTFPGSGPPTITVSGLNLLHRFRTKQEVTVFRNKRETEIAKLVVEQIAAEIKKRIPGIELRLGPKDEDENQEPKKEEPVPFVLMDNQYPIVFLRERARLVGYELSIEEPTKDKSNVVIFHYRRKSGAGQPAYTLEWGKSLVSFTPTLQMANQVSEVTVRGWDAKAKAEIKETFTAAELVKEGVVLPADLLLNDAATSAKKEIVVDEPVKDKREAKERAKRRLRQILQETVIAKGKTVGLPGLRAGTKVCIWGLGARFSGPEPPKSGPPPKDFKPRFYLITESTHTFGESGYTTEFTARMET